MLYAIAAVIVLIIDQATKYWTILNLVPGGAAKPLIPGFIELVHVHNTGAAFGLLDGGWARWLFVGLTAVFAVVVIVLLSKKVITGGLGRWSLVMILAGGLGNCIDRAINGYVVDMFNFEFMEFAVFNVADIFITIFGIIFCCYLLFHKEPEKKAPAAEPRRPMPRATENPKKGADYLTQLQKPVVQGKQAIENERRRSAPTPTDDSFSAWNIPQSETKAPPAAAPSRNPSGPARPVAPEPRDSFMPEQSLSRKAPSADFSAPAARPRAAAPSAPASPASKSSGEFSIEDIIAEFKD